MNVSTLRIALVPARPAIAIFDLPPAPEGAAYAVLAYTVEDYDQLPEGRRPEPAYRLGREAVVALVPQALLPRFLGEGDTGTDEGGSVLPGR